MCTCLLSSTKGGQLGIPSNGSKSLVVNGKGAGGYGDLQCVPLNVSSTVAGGRKPAQLGKSHSGKEGWYCHEHTWCLSVSVASPQRDFDTTSLYFVHFIDFPTSCAGKLLWTLAEAPKLFGSSSTTYARIRCPDSRPHAEQMDIQCH